MSMINFLRKLNILTDTTIEGVMIFSSNDKIEHINMLPTLYDVFLSIKIECGCYSWTLR